MNVYLFTSIFAVQFKNEVMGTMLEEDVKIEICKELKNELALLPIEEKQVIIHCSIYGMDFGDAARIWKSTYLIDKTTNEKYKMLFPFRSKTNSFCKKHFVSIRMTESEQFHLLLKR